MKHGKKYLESAKLIESNKLYDPEEAVKLALQTAKTKFDETMEISVRLGVDPRQADQQVRGAVVLPHGTGKKVRVLVFAKGEQAKAAEEAGADYVGAEELVAKIQGENWFEFDTVIASPNMMGVVGRLGKVLGPKGLMPSPKAGTVTPNIVNAIKEAKAGKIEAKANKLATDAKSAEKARLAAEAKIKEERAAAIAEKKAAAEAAAREAAAEAAAETEAAAEEAAPEAPAAE